MGKCFGGMGSALFCIYCDNTLVLPAPGVRLNPENYTTLLQHGKCTATAAPPAILEAMLNYTPGVDALAGLKHIAYTGGPLNPIRGEALAKKLPHLFTVLASTEGGIGRFVSSGDSSHWDSFKFVDLGQRMEEVSPGIYELVYPRTELINQAQAFFHTHPHLSLEFRTSDLFAPLDSQHEWWRYKGRADNWIAMSNGLKMDPTEMEHIVAAHPDITGVIVAGSHRFRLCLLIEPRNDVVNPSLETIWPIVEKANMQVPKFGRVPKELILFAAPDRPFLRAGKGTIQRRLTVQAYEEDIERRYDQVEEGLLTSGITPPSSMKTQDLIPFLESLCSQTLLDEDSSDSIGIDDDLLAFGLDSLSAFIVLARLKAALRQYGVEADKVHSINNHLLYNSKTIRQLAERLSPVLATTGTSSGSVGQDFDDATTRLSEKYIAKVRELVGGRVAQGTKSSSNEVVILTGSTGSLGSYILSSLLARGDVKKVICLNRNGDAKAQSASFRARGLPELPINDQRVVFLQVKPTVPKLGIPDEDYDLLKRETTSIIHNAFPVNFLLSLDSFEPQFQYLLNLLNLAIEGHQSPSVLFVSSITAGTPVASDGHQETIPENVLELSQSKFLLHQGYARAKYICEILLANYALASGRSAAVLRVGQVCGPLSGTGVWNTSEWVPSLVLSSKYLGALPDTLGSLEVDWVPVDKLGDIVAEIMGVTSKHEASESGFQVYNVVNPTTTPWGTLLPAFSNMGPLAVVSAPEWVDRLERSDKGHHVIHENPAAKIIDFYKQTMVGMKTAAKVETGSLLLASKTAGTLPAIEPGHVVRWMQGWGL
ncbi:putative secondary metabolism biosynthetic enzyme [Diatrype stigma]|uniref:Secondary metabolism biosynthetic enzyme n=1 Tax=Diatrype stigma TaxID=117547 RepID=A0AAN9YT63_9PEZI